MGTEQNGNGATVDWRSVALQLTDQVASMTLELAVRGSVIERLQAEVARLSSVNESERVK